MFDEERLYYEYVGLREEFGLRSGIGRGPFEPTDEEIEWAKLEIDKEGGTFPNYCRALVILNWQDIHSKVEAKLAVDRAEREKQREKEERKRKMKAAKYRLTLELTPDQVRDLYSVVHHCTEYLHAHHESPALRIGNTEGQVERLLELRELFKNWLEKTDNWKDTNLYA